MIRSKISIEMKEILKITKYHKYFTNFRFHKKSVCTVHVPKEKADIELSRQEASTMHHLVSAQYETGLVETQDGFFCHLAGRSAPAGLAIVNWIGCINATKWVGLTICVSCKCGDFCSTTYYRPLERVPGYLPNTMTTHLVPVKLVY